MGRRLRMAARRRGNTLVRGEPVDVYGAGFSGGRMVAVEHVGLGAARWRGTGASGVGALGLADEARVARGWLLEMVLPGLCPVLGRRLSASGRAALAHSPPRRRFDGVPSGPYSKQRTRIGAPCTRCEHVACLQTEKGLTRWHEKISRRTSALSRLPRSLISLSGRFAAGSVMGPCPRTGWAPDTSGSSSTTWEPSLAGYPPPVGRPDVGRCAASAG